MNDTKPCATDAELHELARAVYAHGAVLGMTQIYVVQTSVAAVAALWPTWDAAARVAPHRFAAHVLACAALAYALSKFVELGVAATPIPVRAGELRTSDLFATHALWVLAFLRLARHRAPPAADTPAAEPPKVLA